MTAPIIIRDYDPLWPQQFETFRSRIAAALPRLATAIEHVGSTAVPGLAAKPVIDIDVLVRSATDLPLVIKRLASVGYEHHGDLGVTGREAFRAPADYCPHHLYVCPPDNEEYRRHITFRDHLRAHPEDANAYLPVSSVSSQKNLAPTVKLTTQRKPPSSKRFCAAPVTLGNSHARSPRVLNS
jgi:GrpB-like predicted nucleotidyltransferase (UPF0157 family)